jgi:hypothetical protein
VFAPPIVKPPESTIGLPKGLPALRLGFRLHKVGKSLDLSQVQSPICKRAPGKFSRIRRTETGEGGKRLCHRRHYRPPAVDVEFRDVLAREAGRRGEKKNQPIVYALAARCAERSQGSPARFRDRIGKRFESESDARPGQADNGNPRRRRSAR